MYFNNPAMNAASRLHAP